MKNDENFIIPNEDLTIIDKTEIVKAFGVIYQYTKNTELIDKIFEETMKENIILINGVNPK